LLHSFFDIVLKRLTYFVLIVFSVLFTGLSPLSAQNHFRVISGIPHLPLIDPASVTTPETGMLIFSSSDLKPMIYTGSGWETLCTDNVSAITAQEYFIVKNGIPFLPIFGSVPTGILASGTIYYSTVQKSVMIYNGGSWVKMVDMLTGSIADNSGFAAGVGVKTFKLPVLNADPTAAGLVAGAFYINSSTKVVRYNDGAAWQDVSCQPVVKTISITNNTGYTAESGADVLTNGGSPVTLTGICWSPNSDPDTLLTSKTRIVPTGSGIGIFASQMTGLLPLTTYHVRAYAVNNLGIVYGEEVVFTTPIAPPTIITLDATNIKPISVQTGGDITADGGSPVTKRGVIWSAISDPLNDASHIITNDGSGVGYFPTILDGLLGNTTYYVRAYAVNAAKTAYGNLVQFTTPEPVPPELNPTLTLDSITGSSMIGTALILNNGGALVTERGVCYSVDQLNYTYIPSSTVTPTDIGKFITKLTGLSQGTTYYLKGYAKNSAGIGYTSETSSKTAAFASIITVKPTITGSFTAQSGGEISNTGYSTITKRGICWSITKNPTVDSLGVTSEPIVGDGTGTYTSTLSTLVPGTNYYVRAYAVNAAGTAYGNLDSIAMPDYAKVQTLAASSLYMTTATCGGNVLSDGGVTVTERGVCWSISANPTISNPKTSDGDGLGLFTSYLTGMTPNVVYHYRAYAVNSVGVSYGDDLTFTIIPDAPYIITLPITDITSMSGISGGDIQSSGGAPITLRGIIWSTKGDPSLDPHNTVTNDGSGVGIFPTKMQNLLGSTTYYVRAYAVNAYGKSFGDLKIFTTLPPVLAEIMPPTFDIKDITSTKAIGEFLILNNGGDPVTDRGIRYTTDRVNYTYVSSQTLNPTDIGTFVSKLTGLAPNTVYYAEAYAINKVGTAFSTETSFRTSTPATLTTITPKHTSGFTAESGGDITNTGYSIISSRGICWSTDKNPTIDSLKTSDPVVGDGTGTYASTLIGLLPGTTYYVRAYAVNSAGVGYGNLDSIAIPNFARVVTIAASSLYASTATCGGDVLSDGGSAVTERGVCWSTAQYPTIANTRTSDGTGLGLFTSYLLGLTPNVEYHFRAYAVTSIGVAYGDDLTLKVIPDAPIIITLPVTEITSMSGNSGGDIQSSGGAPITHRGILWSTNGDPRTNPLTTITTNDGSGVGIFPTKMENLLGNTTYYVRAYAVNSYGDAYGDLKIFTTLPPILAEVMPPTFSIYDITNYTATGEFLVKNNGGDPITDRGIRYSTDGVNYTYVSSTTLNKTDIGTFRSKLTGLLPNTTYYAQAYAINNVGMALSSEASFRTTSLVILTTISPNAITGFTANSGGDITSTGDDIVSAKGICWSTDVNPTVDLATKTSEALSGTGTGTFVSLIKNLTPGVKYYVRAYAVNSFGVAYGNLDSLFTATTALITTIRPTNVTNVSAITGGFVNDDGDQEVYTRGICWSMHPNPSLSDNYIANGSGIGSFAVTLTDLMGSTKYYVKAYAVNSVGTAYGNLDSIKTSAPKLEAVTTTDVINIGGTTALGRGYVGKIGGAQVTERGFCWNTTGGASVDGPHAACGTSGNGSFAAGLTGLTPNTKYYARAYAANNVGVSYGDEITFSTFTIATIITTPASEITSTTAKSGGDIVSDGGALVYSSGICWNTTGNPTISDAGTNSGLGIGNFIHSLNGLMGSTKYYIRAYAINDAGTAYGNVEVFTTAPAVPPTLTTTAGWSGGTGTTGTSGGTINSNGGAIVNTQGIVWSTTSGFLPDTVTVNKTVLSGTGNFSSTLTNLRKGTTYYVRAYATNTAGIAYAGNEISFTTFDLPVVSTVVPYGITNVTATSGGNITSNGGTEILESGLCWSTDILPTISNSLYSNGPAFGLFYRTISELLGSTTYYTRAYAINSVGIVYGQVESFTTAPPTLATIVTNQPVATSSVTAVSGGNVVSHGGSLVTSRGIYWSTQSGFNPDTITVNKTAQTGYYKGSFTAYMTGLTPNTVYYVKAYVENAVGTAYGDEMSFRTPTLPTLTTAYAYATGPTKAISGGNITNDGGAGISSRGVLWSRVPSFNPDTVTLRTYNGGGSGNFGSTLTELKGNTTYYVQAYATNIAGTSYGNILSFITDPATLATVSTRDAWNVYGTTAVSGGYVSDNGGEPILSRGMLWATTPDFRPDTVVVNKAVQGAMGLGYFSTGMGILSRGTTYYACAYATNSIGVAYGNVISFTTLDFAKLTTMPVFPSSTGYEASGGGTLISDGGTPITNNGVCWSVNPTPTVGLYTKTTYDAWSGSNFYSNLKDLKPATKYYVRAYTSNNQGVAYGNEVSFTSAVALPVITTNYVTQTSKSSVVTGGNITFDGGGAITERGVIWSTDAGFDPDTVVVNKTSNGVGTGKFNSVISGMQLSISYYIRAYAVNSAGISYGNQVRITLFPTAPVLNTLEITQVKGSSAMSGGEITSDGGADVTLKGLCWNTSTNPINTNNHTTNGFGTDAYTAMLSGLLPNTLYYVRAYAVNKIGTAYGIERTFQTNGIPTLTATTPVTNIIATTATSGGKITDDGRSPIITRGICWSTYSNPTVALTTKTVDNSSTSIGSFIANMKGLTPATTYYVRSYATNEVGTGYGSQVQFSTLAVQLPTLTTIPPFNVDSVKATSGGDIYDDGGMPITAKGICWNTAPNPTIALATRITYPTAGDTTYTSTFVGLSPGTKYYVRAFAINSKGTGYGNLDSLTTQVIRASVSNVVISNITKVAANGAASVITDGGAPVTVRGLCWNMTGHPTIADDTLNVGKGIGNFADTLKNIVEGKVYYVRAFAINSAGIAYSAVDASFQICPSAFTVLHYEGLNGAAVTKTVTYGSVSTSISGASKCWITQNLGADHQAISAADGTEPSAGWYWQFNRVQGYQFAAARYPLTWVSSISENSNWIPANDPCNLLLGNGWRIPTGTEWTNAKGAPQNWANTTNAYNSILKLHNAGYLGNGAIVNRTVQGDHWSSTQINNTDACYTGYSSSSFGIAGADANSKSKYAFSLRCLRDSIVISKPSVSNVTIVGKSKTTVIATAAATPDGGTPVMDKGFCWNTTGNPGLSDHVVAVGDSVGIFTDSITGLVEGTTYYIRAFATNNVGTAYSSTVTEFKVCLPQFTVQHVAGLNGAPVDKMVTYHSVSTTYSGAARCWITQNLGADHEASSVVDATEPSAGWYWQFNRIQGYKYAGSRTPATTWTSNTESSDWISANDPCSRMLGGGWRIPTSTEYANVIANGGIPFSTPLKLHYSGNLSWDTGTLQNIGSYGIFWTSSATTTTYATYLQFSSGANQNLASYKSHGFTLRCLKDTIVISTPSVSNVTFSAMTSSSVGVSAIVTPDGGSPVTERGFCWNTTGNPTISDNKIASGADVGNFTATISGGLVEGPTYYVKAYAKNSIGLAYGAVNSFKICPPVFTVQHIAGIDGAPVSKRVAYHSVSSTLSGKAVCWLTQNLGADSIASANTDATEQAGGWYWQFNRIQGFKNDGTVRTPATSWIAINETSNWVAQNDPCTQLLGSGWRIPTNTEWVNVIANGNLATAMAYNSPLKMHMAGNLDNGSFINKRGVSYGLYWSSTQSAATTGYSMYFSTAGSVTYNLHSKSQYGFSIRCLRDTIVIASPSVGQVSVSISSMTGTSADVSAAVGSDGGAAVSARGFCWNTTGNPTLSDNHITDSAIGTGNFTGTITGLTEGPKYYVRAYATNSIGTTYGEGSGFSAILTTLCPDTFNIQHTIGYSGAPVTKAVTYHAIGSYLSGAAKCWITQNLGADHPATSAVDATEASGGWYFQFNHLLGYKNAGTTTPIAWYGGFSESTNWTAINDPCTIMLGTDWRIPTFTEWQNATGAPRNWASQNDAYNTELKLHNAGYLAYNTGGLGGRGTQGNYWSSTQLAAATAYDLQFYSAASAVVSHDKAYGFSVRCLRDGVVKMPPTLSNVTLSSTAMTDSTAEASATILADGGAVVTERGICWNSTGNPTISDYKAINGTTDLTYLTTMIGLKEGMTYYVRAYAVNKIGLSYSPIATSFKICKPVKAIHIAGLNGAPVSKTVTYGTVSTNITGKLMCWLTQNLGSDQQATSVTDASEASSGWYWQFNRLQGYKYTTVRTPNDAWVPWITSITESTDWQPANDPCNRLLGLGWRIPTSTEWTAADAAPQNWTSSTNTYASVLKLHQAGEIEYSNGVLYNRGSYGYYWSSTQYPNSSNGSDMYIYNGYSDVTYINKAYALSVRCLRDTIVLSKPVVSNVVVPDSTLTSTSAIGMATVSSDGGSIMSSRGLCWNTKGNPTISDNILATGSGVGKVSEKLIGLKEGPTYYVRAYATNAQGTAYSPAVTSFKICPTEFSVIHTAGLNGAPVTKTVTYHSISSNISGAARCWLTQNLGADQQATSVTDATEASAGWYWQFNRLQGYKFAASRVPADAWVPWITSITESTDWQPANDPCNRLLGLGWRIPTAAEWTAADAPPQNWGTAANVYNSELKLHEAGMMEYTAGGITNRGGYGYYWSSTQYPNSSNANFMYIYNGYSDVTYFNKAYACPVRCLRDTIVIAIPVVSDVTVPTATMTTNTAVGLATVASDGGSAITSRGICWNTTGSPKITDNVVSTGSGVGSLSEILSGLVEGPTYYVRAYATNTVGTGYSPVVTSFKICPTNFTVIHTAGLNGAPVSKNVVYHSISTNISGAARCWLIQNLGADTIANAVTDPRERSAGWYWQFNRLQGYQYTTYRLPNDAWVAWNTSITESTNWEPANDPCNMMLGLGWRIPTSTEWTAADAPPQNWGSSTAAYNSVLKLHQAGEIEYSNGVLYNRGSYGYYWSSTQYPNSSNGSDMYIYNGYSDVTYINKAYALSVRCLRDTIVLAKPTVSNVTIPTASMTTTTADGTAVVASDGGAVVTERGLCWSTTHTVPTIGDNKVIDGEAGTGSMTLTLAGLTESPTYYVRAYATNSKGTAYSPLVSSFKICPTNFSVIHTAGLNGAPVTKTVTYHSISSNISGAARCWLTQNLGADQQATSVTDATETSAGWYWQFNQLQGYKFAASRIPADVWTPWISSITDNNNWQAANDPCNRLLGLGWRIPTAAEWTTADAPPQNWGTAANVYNSELKLHEAGMMEYTAGGITNRGGYGYYWSSTQYPNSSNGSFMYIYNGYSDVTYFNKAYACPVRCLRDTIVIAMPVVSDVTVPTATMTTNTAVGLATVASNGGSAITSRGICWNTTGSPTTSDYTASTGSGIGDVIETLGSLVEGPTYYVRAYATNAKGTSYSPTVSSFKICPTTFTVIHTAGLNGAPVTKTVDYHSISSNISGAARCWLTQNLGASQQATAYNDNTEESGGWYWQFNRSQGYQYTGSRTPNYAWVPWNTSITESSDWAAANDPCNLLLGLGWRIPTSTEWKAADAPPQNWGSATDAYASVLKLHEAGEIEYSNGVLYNRGSYGYYWSSTQYPNSSNGSDMYIYNGYSDVTYINKAYALSVRCLRDAIVLAIPSVSDVTIPTSTMTTTTAKGTATVASDGGAAVAERGLCWSTTKAIPTINDNKVVAGVTGTGSMTLTLAGLTESPTYYVRAYATNSQGTAYSSAVTSFKICPTEFSVIHTAGLNGAPVTKTVTYHSISSNISGAARCWLTQNLGADQQAISVTDATEASSGWYWQFNRLQGYKYSSSRVPADAWTPWISSITDNNNWQAANDPCNRLLGLGWRIPTAAEWTAADAPPQNWGTAANVYNSELKLHEAGMMEYTAGGITNRGGYGYYWSSTQYPNSSNGNFMYIYNGYSDVTYFDKAYACPVRCLRDTIVIAMPVVSDVAVPTATMTTNTAVGLATVASNGGSAITSRGICWNTTGSPTTSDYTVSTGSGIGDVIETLGSLVEGPTYYVRAYAINAKGTSYSPTVSSFKICPTTFTVIHTAGLNGAPVTKTVDYHSISSNISGAARCWLTQNLGATQQATAYNDNTEASGGWYWQFNRSQGYQYTGGRTPSYGWVPWNTSITESSDWAAANDPCNLLLGSGWRIPTSTEWKAADAPPQNWGSATDAYASVLKLHEAGEIEYSNGVLYNRGSYGYYWSSTQYPNSSNGSDMYIYNGYSDVTYINKAYALSVRCLRDYIVPTKPGVSDVSIPTATMTNSTATGTATVTPNGGADVTDRGLCWNTTGTPTTSDNILSCGTGTGIISNTLTGLTQGPTYYVRAYATNIAGTTYSSVVSSFRICPTTFTVNHTAGVNGAAVTKTVNYGSISSTISGAAKCWLTQNLGATQQAASVTDATEASSGWYWQFNRSQGYQYTGARTPATAWNTSITESSNWSPANDPCTLLLGTGWRIPTSGEWTNADAPPQYWLTAVDSYNSVLRLHQAGYLDYSNGVVYNRGGYGYYWSSTQYPNSSNGSCLYIYSGYSDITYSNKANTFSVRCIQD
jgi:hypothetical protein